MLNKVPSQQISVLVQELPSTKLDVLAAVIDCFYIVGSINRQEFGELLFQVEQRKFGELDVGKKLQQLAADINEILTSRAWQRVIDTEDCHHDLPADLHDALHYIRECEWKYAQSKGGEI